ncbi:MAG: DUF5666 domain-containing protein [Anaerolineales bacterium]
MNEPLIEAFDDCLRAMDAGASLEAALARYPHLAAELRPMLLAARAAQPAQPIRVPRQSEEVSHARFIARARELRQSRKRGFGQWLPQFSLATRLALGVLAIALGGFGMVSASASSLPGEGLYGVKRAVEQAQLSFTPAEARLALEQEFERRRADEVLSLLDRQRETEVQFVGIVESINGEQWVVRGLGVRVPSALHTGFAVGDRVRVTGNTQTDGIVRATRLEKLADNVTPMPTVAPSTPPMWQSSETPEPSETEENTETETQPAQTQSSGSGPSPSKTPQPTQTSGSGGGSGPSPSNTPVRTAPPTGTQSGPSPSNTPDPTETEEPEEVEFEGTLQSINPWTVNGQVFVVNAETEFRDNPQVGDRVKIKAYRFTDGTLLARRIEKD